MKNLVLLGLAISLLGTSAVAAPQRAFSPFGREVDFDEPSRSLHGLLSKMESKRADGPNDSRLQAVLNSGKRLYEWLDFINAHRTPENRLSYSSPETQAAFPIERPRLYNEAIVLQRDDDFRALAPDSLQAVLFSGAPYTEAPPMSDAEFVRWGHHYDSIYQLTARWLGMRDYLGELGELKQFDVRGYHYLQKEADLLTKLQGWSAQTADTQGRLRPWLQSVCMNSEGLGDSCAKELVQAETQSAVLAYYEKYLASAKENFDSFFVVAVKRKDVTWNSSSPSLARIPFLDPGIPVIKSFLSDNIEDEWRWNGWKLELDFQPTGTDIPHMVFEAGTVPHVDELGGNVITMDANEPLSEYNVRWTIRHEFGHVLGLPDCYIEFFDREAGLIVNYQLDTGNLMCSRRGHLNDTIFDAMKAAYFR